MKKASTASVGTKLKRAVIYIRVSSKQQAVRDGNPEGYSLPTQREACIKKAEALGAEVVGEYIDKDSATTTDKRPGFQQLVERVITERNVDYVIIFKLDRFARNRRDDAVVSLQLKQAGATLVSCVEHIDGTASGELLQGVLAAMNEFYSRNLGDEIKRKTLQKVLAGGTPGPARLGYRNVGENGRRYVEVDPEPAELITWCFETYATGDWSVTSLLNEATKRGLRSRGGPTTPRKELSPAQLHRILSSPYYKGTVTYNGVHYQGKHEPLIDPDTWQRVQDVLSANAQGQKVREHHHYLKGTIWCGHCGSRLCITHSRGKLGEIYPYYFCLGRHQRRTECVLKYRPLAIVEEQIEEHYRQVQIKTEGLEETAEGVIDAAVDQFKDFERAQRRSARRIDQLEAERTKLMHAHYAGAVPLDLLGQEQDRIERELDSLRSVWASSQASHDQLQATVKAAVGWARNCHRAYIAASPQVRRLMNQAFFKRVWVTEDGVVGWEYNEPFDILMTRHGRPSQFPDISGYERASGPSLGAFSLVGSKERHLAEEVGFEPTVALRPQRFSRPSDSSALALLQASAEE